MRSVLAWSAMALSLLAAHAPAGTNTSLRAAVYGLAQDFRWEEFAEGNRLLEETGSLFGIGASLQVPFQSGPRVDCAGDVLYGDVDYDGARQDGMPVQSDTSYSWLRGEVNLALPLEAAPWLVVSPYGGIGAQVWDRKLQDTEISFGYRESWWTLYGQLGAELQVPLAPRRALFGRAALRLPIDNTVSYDLGRFGGSSDVDAEPGKELTWRAEAGFQGGLLRMTVYLEQLEFSPSDPEDAGDGYFVYQPRSEARMMGLTLGAAF